MQSGNRKLLLLQRILLASALVFPAATSLGACGGDDTGKNVNPAGDGSDDPGDGSGDTGDGTETPTKDAGKAKDSGIIKVPTTDAGTPSTSKDAATPVKGMDGGGTTGGGSGSDGSTPPTSTPPTDADPTEASATAVGPYTVKTYTSGYADSPDYADATMHYPDGLAGPLPSIAIVPGFASAQSTIQMWGPFLASHGIVTFTIGTNSTLDQPDARSTALLGAIGTIKSENTRADSPLKGKLDLDRMAIGGWSMGGGGTLITLNAHPEFKAAIAFCPWDPGATFPKITTPIIFLAAANDELAAGQSQPFYESVPASTPKLLWERSDADHFNNDPSYENGAMGRYGLSFLKTYLVGDDRYKQFLLVKGPNASDWRSNLQ